MKAVIIPTILAATVLVAAMFAFMPIEKAATVHTTIQSSLSLRATTPIGGNVVSLDPDGPGGTTAAASANANPVAVLIQVVQNGQAVTSGVTFTATQASIRAGATTAPSDLGALTAATSQSNGVWKVSIDPANNWASGEYFFAIKATVGTNSSTDVVQVTIP